MKTIRDVFAAFKMALTGIYETNELEAITLLAVSEISGLTKAKIKAFPENELNDQQLEKLFNVLDELKTGKPLQYILGETEFYGLTFKVDPAVLIPRPETEELVEWVLSSVGSEQLAVGSILDIGTGSGCIAISVKKNLPDVKVRAIDISSNALKTAKENAKVNNVDIDFIEADILNQHSLSQISNLIPIAIGAQISIIVSNPPYVTLHDKTQMHQNVTGFEPHTALFVPENDPLLFYKAIADFALDHLTEKGLLFFEINESYGQDVVDLLSDKGYKNIELKKDMSGRDRMIKASM